MIVQRFQPGHKFYTDRIIKNSNPAQGCVGSFNSVFGQLVNDKREFICYTLERLDTLISEGKRKYKTYFSPDNKCTVLLFEDEPGSGTFNRKFELHPANWAFQLKGCTAVGALINIETPQLISSRDAFNKVMLLAGTEGFITHEKFINQLT